jgi:hypothetical protein
MAAEQAQSIKTAYYHNPSSLRNPTTSDDLTEGYGPGSTWLNTLTGGTFICLSSATGAAVWRCQTGWWTPL